MSMCCVGVLPAGCYSLHCCIFSSYSAVLHWCRGMFSAGGYVVSVAWWC